MRHNFLISGLGRTGTKFLSQALHCGSPDNWRVEHEPGFARYRSNLEKRREHAFELFQQDCYGQVNSTVRHWYYELPVRRRAILLRDPFEQLVSHFNKGKQRGREWRQEHLDFFFKGLDWLRQALDRGEEAFFFEDYTTSKEAVSQVAQYVGIPFNPDMSSLANVNSAPRAVDSFSELPDWTIEQATDRCSEFAVLIDGLRVG